MICKNVEKGLRAADFKPDQIVSRLHSAIIQSFDFKVCEPTYSVFEAYDLIRVLETGIGARLVLALLYIHAGRAFGLSIEGIDFPGFFMCRLDYNGQRTLFDPSSGEILDAATLRFRLKNTLGHEAELSADYMKSLHNRAMLNTMQNPIKFKQIDMEDFDSALKTIEVIRMIDPNERRLLFEAGILYARSGQNNSAIKMLEHYIDVAPDGTNKNEALSILYNLRDV